MNQLSAANVPEVPPSISEYTVQPAGSNSRTCPRPSRRLRFPAFYFSPSAPEIHTGVPDERGFVEAIFQGCAFLPQEPTIFEMERLAEYLCELLSCYQQVFCPFLRDKKAACPSRAEARWGHRALHIKGTNTMTHREALSAAHSPCRCFSPFL